VKKWRADRGKITWVLIRNSGKMGSTALKKALRVSEETSLLEAGEEASLDDLWGLEERRLY